MLAARYNSGRPVDSHPSPSIAQRTHTESEQPTNARTARTLRILLLRRLFNLGNLHPTATRTTRTPPTALLSSVSWVPGLRTGHTWVPAGRFCQPAVLACLLCLLAAACAVHPVHSLYSAPLSVARCCPLAGLALCVRACCNCSASIHRTLALRYTALCWPGLACLARLALARTLFSALSRIRGLSLRLHRRPPVTRYPPMPQAYASS